MQRSKHLTFRGSLVAVHCAECECPSVPLSSVLLRHRSRVALSHEAKRI